MMLFGRIIFYLFLSINPILALEWICTENTYQPDFSEQCTITVEYEKYVCIAHTLSVESLPPLSLSSNHTMQTFKINFCQLSTLGQLPFSLPSSVELLDLSFNSLSTFDLSFPLSSNLKHLYLDSNPDLIEVNFGNSRMQQRLISLSLRHNHQMKLTALPPHLTHLDLTDCNLFQSSIFPLIKSLTKLTHLSLADNQLERLPILNENLRLEYLNLSNNSLTSMEDGWLTSSLHTLDLRLNQIQSLEFLRNQFLTISNQVMFNHTLQLSLFGNPLTCDCWFSGLLDFPSLIINDLHRLQCQSHSIMNLSRNEHFFCSYSRHCASDCSCCDFEACDCHAVCPSDCSCSHDAQWSRHLVQCSNANLTNLHFLLPQTITELDYQDNRIEEIKPFVFVGKTSLTKLNLAKNHLKNLSNETFCAATNLKELDLSGNPDLKTIIPMIDELFQCLKHLQFIVLSKDQIERYEQISSRWMIVSNSSESVVRLKRIVQRSSVLPMSSTILTVLLSATNRPIRNSHTQPVTIPSLYPRECTTFIPATVLRHAPFLQHNQTLIIIVFFLLLFVLLFLVLLIILAICRRKLRRHLTAELQRQHAQHYYYHTRLHPQSIKPTDNHGIVGTNDSLYEQLPSLSSDSEQPFLYNEKKCNHPNVPVVPPYPPSFRHHLCCHPTGRLLHPSTANVQDYQYMANAPNTTTTGYSTPTSQQHQCAAILVWANRLLYPTQNIYNHHDCTTHSCPSELQHLQQRLLSSNPQDQTSSSSTTTTTTATATENNILRYCNKETLFVSPTSCQCAGHGQNSDTYVYPHVHR